MKAVLDECSMKRESKIVAFIPPALLGYSPQDSSVWAGPALFDCIVDTTPDVDGTCLYLTRFVRHPHLLLLQLDSYFIRFAEFFARYPHLLPQLF